MSGDAQWVGSMPEVYARHLEPALFAPWAAHVAAVAARLAPRRVLEVAAGTGAVTAELVAALPDAEIVATDLNPAMVEWSAQRVAAARWQQADALDLPFDDAGFDLVVLQFGIMFAPDKRRAFAEAARVLRPGGTLLLTTWDAVETMPFGIALSRAAGEVTGRADALFIERTPHGYHDPDRIRADAEAGGLAVDSLEHVSLTGHAASAAELALGFCQGSPLRFELEAHGPLDDVTRRVADGMTARLGTGPVSGALPAWLLRAQPAR